MRKLTILFAALTLSAGLWAIDGVKYLDANGQEQTANGVTEVTDASATLAAGWYVVKGTDVQTGTLTCQGAVHIILADGAKLTATGSDDSDNWRNSTPGIQISGTGNSLTIYGQSMGDQMGQLKATGGWLAAGIGGGYEGDGSNITINGGMVEATGGAAGIGGGSGGKGIYITINGGTVTAQGGDQAAGIGSGGGISGSGSNITINGGTVEATGGNYGAGIGGGQNGSGSNITINGGTVEATGGDYYGAGIGGGYHGDGSNITISGGTVIATGGENAAGIGGGCGSSILGGGNGTDITINGGKVTATGGEEAAGIGGGCYGAGSNIKVATTHIVKAGATENPTEEIATDRTGDNDIANDLAGKQYVTIKITESALLAYKAAAIEEIEQLATAVKADIDAASAYPSADAIKLDYKAKIDLVIEAATDAINNEASTEAMVDELRDKAMLQINGRKEEALTKIAKINEFEDAKVQAIADITNARQGIQNENLNNWIDGAIKDIQKGGPDATPGINEIKDQILTVINFFKEGTAEGIEEGKAEAQAELPTDPEGTAGHTVTITKDDKTLILVNPDKVTYGKQE